MVFGSIYLHGFDPRVLLAPRNRTILWELGPGGCLVIKPQSGLQELGPSIGMGPFLGVGSWDLTASSTLGSSVGSGS
jgi:hypothetical protein